MSDFWLGFGVASGMFTAGLLVAWWWRARGRWVNWPTRIVPPPIVGRWEVWGLPAGPAVPEFRLGRYRLRWTAWLVAWGCRRNVDRGFGYFVDVRGFEVRRVR